MEAQGPRTTESHREFRRTLSAIGPIMEPCGDGRARGFVSPQTGVFEQDILHDLTRDLVWIVRHCGPWKRMPRNDLAPFLFCDDPAKRVRAPESLPLVGLVEHPRRGERGAAFRSG